MAIRLVVTFTAQPGKGKELAEAFKPTIDITLQEQGCEQYEIFRSEADPDKLVLLERWTDEASLNAHLEAMRARGPSPTAGLRSGETKMERYEAE